MEIVPEIVWRLKVLKACYSGMILPIRTHLVNLPKQHFQLGTKCSNICAYGGHSH